MTWTAEILPFDRKIVLRVKVGVVDRSLLSGEPDRSVAVPAVQHIERFG
jgi:hypothetical protein